MVFFLISTLTGCGVFPHKIKDPEDQAKTLEVPSNNIIMVNAKGRPVDPTGNTGCKQEGVAPCEGSHSTAADYNELEPLEYQAHVDELLNALDRRKGHSRKILIYIHGGLNTQAGAVERATILNKPITDSGYFPIFINWQSSLVTSYKDHIFYLRQGADWREGDLPGKMAGWGSSPFYLIADVSRAIARAPVAMGIQVANDLTTSPALRWGWSRSSPNLPLAEDIAFELLCEQDPTKPNVYNDQNDQNRPRHYKKKYHGCKNEKASADHFSISIGKDDRSRLERYKAFMLYPITLPTKLLTAPIIDALGTSSWDSMLRSQSMLFHYDNDQHDHTSKADENLSSYKSTGALSFFLEKLQKKILCREEPCEDKGQWEITLIGHSAGTIIMNDMLRYYGEMPFQNIVYMSGASTIRDYENVIFPYLRQKNFPSTHGKPNGPVKVYHLMLHEAAESGERNFGDFPPRGSLLVWIDNFLSNPLKKQDLTMGRFVNLMGALHHTPDGLRKYIHVHKFAAGESTRSPQKHGRLGHLKFWDPQCWQSNQDGESKGCFPWPPKAAENPLPPAKSETRDSYDTSTFLETEAYK
jgi:hypothetical protein